MPKYKNINSAIRNWAHSFMSIENFGDKVYFVQALYNAAKTANVSAIEIDILNNRVMPISAHTDELDEFVSKCKPSFYNLLLRQDVEAGMIESAVLSITYDFSIPVTKAPGFHFRSPWKAPEAVTYATSVTATDNRGKLHEASINEWWRN